MILTPRRAAPHCPAWCCLTALLALTSTGCGQILGLDDFKDQPAGAAGAGGQGSSGGGAGGDGGGGSYSVQERVVTERIDGQAAPGVDVIVSGADGALAKATKTGADGTVSVDVPARGSVSALCKVSGTASGEIHTSRFVQTIFDPPDGATLRFQVGCFSGPPIEQPPENAPMGNITLTLGDASPPPGTVLYDPSMPCLGNSPYIRFPHIITGYKGCPGATTYDVFMFAKDGTLSTVAYAAILDQPLQPGSAVTHTLSFRTDMVETRAVIDPIPPGSTRADVTLYAYRTQQLSHGVVDGLIAAPPGASESKTLRMPANTFSKYSLNEQVVLSETPLYRGARRQRIIATLPQSSTFSPVALATVDDVSPPDLGDIAHPVFGWELAQEGELGDSMALYQLWRPGDNETTDWVARFAPVRAGEIRFPDLPAELSEYAPKVGDILSHTTIAHDDNADVIGYADYLGAHHDDAELTSATAQRQPD
jgi:hypothetical protein